MIHIISQALATGMPVISTRHSGIADQIIEGKNGYLVDEGDYKALAERIQYLMEHDDLWADMGEFGRKHVEEFYDSKKSARRHIELYEKLISENKQSS